jgi:hypothetical protein
VDAIELPTHAPIERVRDVLLCPTADTDQISPQELHEHPPIGFSLGPWFKEEPSAKVEVGRGIVIERLSDEDSELIMNACTPRGHYFAPFRQFGQRYAFVREVDVEQWQRERFRWDPDGVLSDALNMSRLIRDNAYSQQFAARIADFEDGQQTVVYTLSAGKWAYRLRRDRDWLDPDEGSELRNLLAALWAGATTRPDRIRRAMWRAEWASWVAWANVALPVLVGGLESLLKTERHHATRQFATRVTALAADLGFEGITADLCEAISDARSEWVHGTPVRLFTAGQKVKQTVDDGGHEGPDDEAQARAIADIARLQDVLRRAVRRCIEDDDFGALFADDGAIRARWPL